MGVPVLPYTLTAHTDAVAAEVMANFNALVSTLTGGIDVDNLEDGAVTAPKLATGAVTNTKLGANAVTTDKILDGTIATADLADASVTTAKLGAAAVQGGQYLLPSANSFSVGLAAFTTSYTQIRAVTGLTNGFYLVCFTATLFGAPEVILRVTDNSSHPTADLSSASGAGANIALIQPYQVQDGTLKVEAKSASSNSLAYNNLTVLRYG